MEAKPRNYPFGVHWLAGLVAGLCCAVGLALSVHYPAPQLWMVGFFAVSSFLFYIRPASWLIALPAMLPVVGLAPWTGWLTFEELDVLTLAAATGGYGRLAVRGLFAHTEVQQILQKAERHKTGMSVVGLLLAALFGASVLVAMFRGFADAGGFTFGWYQGYHEPMNSVRLTKSFFEVLLLLPLWQAAQRQNPERVQRFLPLGLMLGLATASLATIWERAAFTGLLNFSSDYRTTGLFWEMHVGGAALDGFLAVTVPFAVRELLVARTPLRWGVAATVLGLAAYACLTTFSRGVYLAIPLGTAVLLGLHAWQRGQLVPANAAPLVAALLLIVGFGLGAGWMFQTSGYRGTAALLATVALMLPLASVMRGFSLSQWLLGVVLGAVLVGLAMVTAWLLPKGAYVVWGLAVLLTVAMLLLLRRGNAPPVLAGPLAFAGFAATVAGTALVADHWGDAQGLQHAVPVLLALLCVCAVAGAARKPLWPDALRWQAATVVTMSMVAAVTGIFGGGSYMTDRISTGGQDITGRLAHWQLGRDMLRTQADWWLGKGMGRFPSNYFLAGNPSEHPGDYRLKQEGKDSYLTLTGGLHINGFGEIFRVTQRIAEPGRGAVVSASVRSAKDVTLHFEVCQKHLLYGEGCVTRELGVKGSPGVWQVVRAELQGNDAVRGDWYAPKLLAFSMAMESRGGMADLDNVGLTRADGRQLLANGDFADGMAHWFFSSDRHHLPWHIKNVFMNVLFDQGIVGVTLWSLLLAAALWRTTLGKARRHPLAPALAASLTGFVAVGLFDSLLDVPRLAWLFYLLLLVALSLRGPPRAMAAPGSSKALAGLALAVVACWVGLQPGNAQADQATPVGRTIQVGPARTIKKIADSSILVRENDTIEVDAGVYAADVAVWERSGITVRAVGGRVQLLAQGSAAEGKGTWVVRASGMRVEGFDFVGSRVPGRNGAGIRLEKGSLRVRDCTFTHNENGILTSNQPDAELDIENSEFGHNGHGDGQSHNLYVGAIARLAVTGSYFHHAKVGHLLKSRAAVNRIVNNRLTDEAGGTTSYELEFPNGGVAHVVGNVIAQSASTENPHLISFGAERYTWPRNQIHLENNTLVNPLPQGGVFLRVAPGADAISAINNRLIGPGKLESAGPGEYLNNVSVDPRDYARELKNSTHNPEAIRR